MKVFEILESSKIAFKRQGSKISRKYRCTTGLRKGQVRSSPAACNAPLNPSKARSLKITKAKRAPSMKIKRKVTMKSNPASLNVRRLNKPLRRKKMR